MTNAWKMVVNGTIYESNADVALKANTLRGIWEKTLNAFHDEKDCSLLCQGVLEEFDSAYVEFEKAYVGFLISVEASCKSILVKGNAFAAALEDGNRQAHEDFVGVLQQLNS